MTPRGITLTPAEFRRKLATPQPGETCSVCPRVPASGVMVVPHIRMRRAVCATCVDLICEALERLGQRRTS